MKYRLKKALPTFKAGDLFHISPNKNLVHTESGTLAYMQRTLEQFPNILKDWFEEIPEPKTVWDLEEGDECWVVNSGLHFTYAAQTWWAQSYAHDREVGDVFLTQVECCREIAYRKAKQILLRDTKGFKPKKDTGVFYVVYWDVCRQGLYVDCYQCGSRYAQMTGPLNFADEEDARESIRKHRAEWLTYLGVEE